MKRKNLVALAGSICLLLLVARVHAQQAKSLTIEVTHFKGDHGQAVVHLFRKLDDIPKKPYLKLTAMIINKKATLIFDNIPYGEYAAIVFHDENSNGELDHRFGFPNEPMGFSNQWKLSLFSGMPT
ncbi:MAG TPA: DUF2141 domain-containing protein [Cyclobacteriaceae bacterium]|jgi:uncharacterized protein (DUF2141 family)|nr:DUF2141 domain-containing protein [Cyclobacteriaceae bacterium]